MSHPTQPSRRGNSRALIIFGPLMVSNGIGIVQVWILAFRDTR